MEFGFRLKTTPPLAGSGGGEILFLIGDENIVVRLLIIDTN